MRLPEMLHNLLRRGDTPPNSLGSIDPEPAALELEEKIRSARDQEIEDIRRAMAEDRRRLMRLQAEADLPRVTLQHRRRKND